MNSLPSIETGSGPKSFWQRKEGLVGMAILVILGVLCVGSVAPYITLALQNITNMLIAAAITVVVGTIVTSKTVWSWFFGALKIVSRRITNIFVDVFPIDIMKNYVDKLANKKQEIVKQRNNVRGQMGQLRVVIDTNTKEMQENFAVAKAAKSQNKQMALALNIRNAGRLEKSNMSLEQLYKKLEGLIRILNKMYDAADFYYNDIKQNVALLERESTAITAGYNAMKAAMSFIMDASDDKLLYDAALESLMNDMGAKLGAIEDFMEAATPFIETIDLKNMALDAAGLESLEAWEKKADDLVLGDTKQLMLAGGAAFAEFTDITQPEQVPVGHSSDGPPKLLKKRS